MKKVFRILIGILLILVVISGICFYAKWIFARNAYRDLERVVNERITMDNEPGVTMIADEGTTSSVTLTVINDCDCRLTTYRTEAALRRELDGVWYYIGEGTRLEVENTEFRIEPGETASFVEDLSWRYSVLSSGHYRIIMRFRVTSADGSAAHMSYISAEFDVP